MSIWAALAVLCVAALVVAVVVFLAWRLLVCTANIIIRIDRAVFGGKGKKAQGPALERAQAPALPVEFSYRDAEGAETRRAAIIQEVRYEVGRPASIEAFCLVRRAPRTFKVRSMTDVHDLRTGEVVEDVGRWLAQNAG